MLPKLRLVALPLLILPLYSIASSLEACTSGGASPTGTTASGLSCTPGTVPKHLPVGDVCCTDAPGEQSCRQPGDPAVGDPCPAVNRTTPGHFYTASFDVCVVEHCSGDRECEEFPLVVENSTGTLVCLDRGLSTPVWEWQGAPAVHRVERACLTARTEVCQGSGYGSASPDAYGYAASYWPGYASVCGYGTYGEVVATVNVRELFVISSTCASAAGAPGQPCDVADL
jgi:hypothetical protein